MSFNVSILPKEGQKFTGEVVRVEKIDGAIHGHLSGRPFTPAELKDLGATKGKAE